MPGVCRTLAQTRLKGLPLQAIISRAYEVSKDFLMEVKVQIKYIANKRGFYRRQYLKLNCNSTIWFKILWLQNWARNIKINYQKIHLTWFETLNPANISLFYNCHWGLKIILCLSYCTFDLDDNLVDKSVCIFLICQSFSFCFLLVFWLSYISMSAHN